MPIGRLICRSGILRNGSILSVSAIIPVYLNTAKMPMSSTIVRIKNSFFFFLSCLNLSTKNPPR